MLYKECIKIWMEGQIDKLLNKLLVKSTYCSNKIENNQTRLRNV
ncbi:hypothetical protein [Clostridium sp. FP2]|nr:hypothetical protein [Clostridium sp. FP2]